MRAGTFSSTYGRTIFDEAGPAGSSFFLRAMRKMVHQSLSGEVARGSLFVEVKWQLAEVAMMVVETEESDQTRLKKMQLSYRVGKPHRAL